MSEPIYIVDGVVYHINLQSNLEAFITLVNWKAKKGIILNYIYNVGAIEQKLSNKEFTTFEF